jgi:hypothetical protein
VFWVNWLLGVRITLRAIPAQLAFGGAATLAKLKSVKTVIHEHKKQRLLLDPA